MDNQLKNVKTHARLLSKGMWYEWRMILLATLKDGLFKTADGMTQDGKILDKQLALLNSALPKFVRQAKQLEQEEADLQSAAEDLANCDQGELSEARQQLITVDADIEAKRQLIAELQKQLQGKEAEILLGTERKQFCLGEIREAEKIREECRGWSSSEISQLKGSSSPILSKWQSNPRIEKVDQIEKAHGWTITGVSGTTTSMTYRKEIELVFDASSFFDGPRTKQIENSRVDIWYIAASRELCPVPLTPELDFFLKNIRDHVRGLPQAQTPIRNLLREVSTAWNKASAVASSIRLLKVSCPTEITTTSDNSILVKQMLLIAPLTTKVEITFQLTCRSSSDGITVGVSPSAAVVYGERFNEPKMGEFLLSRCGNCIEEKGQATKASWGAAVAELGEKLLARGRK
jgi:kinetochore protein Spc7/SPC105